ncbi:MAG TPA: hypothetical protein VM677_27215 [Actinokineospora sp.]|nr:hypothetical protein [Actinokineospora sp.]
MAERASLFVSNAVGVPGPITALDGRYGMAALAQGAGLVTARSGFRPAASAPGLVTATGTPNKFIHVAPFHRIHQSLRGGGVYLQTLDAIFDINVIDTYPPDPSNSRRDLVIIHQNDIGFSEADSLMRIRYITGTPGSGSDPSLAAYPEYRTLARVTVPPSATVISPGDIADLRASDSVLFTVATGGVLPIGSVTERAAITAPYDGMLIWRTDRDWIEVYDGTAWRVEGVAICTSTADRDSAITHPRTGQLAQTTNTPDTLWQYDGGTSAWTQLASVRDPRGILGIVQATGNVAFTATETLIDSITFTHTSGRYERGKFDSRFSLNTGGVAIMRYRYVSGSGPVANTDTLIYETIPTGSGSNNHMGISKVFPSVFRSLTSGTYTVGVFATAAAGATSGTINGVANGLERDFLVEDVGAP